MPGFVNASMYMYTRQIIIREWNTHLVHITAIIILLLQVAFFQDTVVAVYTCMTVHMIYRWFCVFFVQALATLKQKVRKYNKDFESGIEAYHQNPVESDEEGEEERDGDERDEGKS